ncbi:MAG: hypothetical protein ACOYNV_27785 [Propionivibrio sp.]
MRGATYTTLQDLLGRIVAGEGERVTQLLALHAPPVVRTGHTNRH